MTTTDIHVFYLSKLILSKVSGIKGVLRILQKHGPINQYDNHVGRDGK